jgi:hypothetical protein
MAIKGVGLESTAFPQAIIGDPAIAKLQTNKEEA